jgi:hypothetical protein
MGLVMQFSGRQSTLEMAVPTMYGIEPPALAIGWLFHQWHGVVLGLVFVALLLNIGWLREFSLTRGGSVASGVGYGVITTLLAATVMPLWLAAIGGGPLPVVPRLQYPGTIVSTAIHVVYAVPLAVTVTWYVNR